MKNIQEIKSWEDVLRPSLFPIFDFISKGFQDKGVFVDVGANAGLVSDFVLEKYPNSTCYLLEPVNYLSDYLFQKYFGKENVTVYDFGLSDKEQKAFITLGGDNLGYNKISDTGEEILLKTFNTVFSSKKIDFIKIDTEGHDILILKSIEDYINYTKIKPYITTEVGWDIQSESEYHEYFKSKYNYDSLVEGNEIFLFPK